MIKLVTPGHDVSFFFGRGPDEGDDIPIPLALYVPAVQKGGDSDGNDYVIWRKTLGSAVSEAAVELVGSVPPTSDVF